MTATPELEKCFEIDYWNGFGFQYSEGMLIIAQLWFATGNDIDEDVVANYVCEKTPSRTVKGVDFLGRKFIKVHFSEWDLIPIIFQCLIDRGDLCVATHTTSPVIFQKGDTFSFREMETKRVAYLNAEYAQLKSWRKMYEVKTKSHVYLKNYNWHTEEGKKLCASIRAEFKPGKPVCKTKYGHYVWPGIDETCRKFKVLWHGGWSAYKPSILTVDDLIPLSNLEVPAIAAKGSTTSGEKDIDQRETASVGAPASVGQHPNVDAQECSICMVNEPDTVVLPCMHKVVCGSCSRELSRTNDRAVCVQCRRPITDVLYDVK